MDSYGGSQGVPSLVLEEQLSQWIDEKRLFRSSDPFEYLKSIEPPVNSVAFEKACSGLPNY